MAWHCGEKVNRLQHFLLIAVEEIKPASIFCMDLNIYQNLQDKFGLGINCEIM